MAYTSERLEQAKETLKTHRQRLRSVDGDEHRRIQAAG